MDHFIPEEVRVQVNLRFFPSHKVVLELLLRISILRNWGKHFTLELHMGVFPVIIINEHSSTFVFRILRTYGRSLPSRVAQEQKAVSFIDESSGINKCVVLEN